ncbi:MAG: arsenate reductase ArsC [Micavibrio sp.]|jgi:arsenate reductase|nr:MAG: arsenate reductase ArsC [Micavibrio sp.]
MKKILVLCTGNSCRSIMAEALINHLGKNRFSAESAGSFPSGIVHPKALEILERYGISKGTPQSKSWDAFSGRDFDLVITVCDQAAGESCPLFLGQPEKLHWSIPDPVIAKGTEDEIDAVFEKTFRLLKEKIEAELLPEK